MLFGAFQFRLLLLFESLFEVKGLLGVVFDPLLPFEVEGLEFLVELFFEPSDICGMLKFKVLYFI